MKIIVSCLLLFALLCFAEGQTCDSNACCEAYQTPNKLTGQGYFEYTSECSTGNGTNCVEIIGCKNCSNPLEASNITNGLPTCSRFEGDVAIEMGTGLEPPCETASCCSHLQNPNPFSGAGYYQYNPTCSGGAGRHCVASTGCSLCSNMFTLGNMNNTSLRPVCERFDGPPVNETTAIVICETQTCCLENQVPNPETGQGYLEWVSQCTDGAGLHCVGDIVGCQLCRDPSAPLINSTFRPVCERFGGTINETTSGNETTAGPVGNTTSGPSVNGTTGEGAMGNSTTAEGTMGTETTEEGTMGTETTEEGTMGTETTEEGTMATETTEEGSPDTTNEPSGGMKRRNGV